MEKILAAEEFIQDYLDVDCDFMESMTTQLDNCSGFGFDNIPDLMVEFAKYHVEAALKAASEKINLTDEVCEALQNHWFKEYIDKDSILNSYPLTNIE
jgi:hypothetical protein